MSQFVFGSGILWGTAQTDAAGSPLATPTPIQFGTLQDVSLDVSFENKTLHGRAEQWHAAQQPVLWPDPDLWADCRRL